MPVCSKIERGKGQLAVWHITEDVNQLLLLIKLSQSDAERFNTFKLDKRKKEWLASRILLQELLGHYPEIEYSENGKPYLKGVSSHISISHTHGFAAASISNQPTALDIEICSQRVEKVADRFMHTLEKENIDLKNRIAYFTVIWSAKETLYKHFDVFGVDFKEQFLVHPFKIEDNKVLSCEFHHQDVIQELKLQYEVNNQYTLVYNL